MNPENIIKQRYESEKGRLQQEFNQEWNVLRSRQADDNSFMKLHDKYRQLANQLNSAVQEQMDQIQEIARLGEQGLVTDPKMTQLRSILPTEARSALPKPAKNVDIMAEYGKLDVYRNRLEQDLKMFVEDPGGEKIKDPFKWWFQESKTKPLLRVNTGARGPGNETVLRMANQTEQTEFIRKRIELQRVKEMQNALLAKPDVTNRLQRAAATSNRMGVGTVATNITAELKDRKPKSKIEKKADPLGLR